MTICEDNHDEICFEGRNCPCCAALAELDEAKRHIDDLD